MQTKTKHDFGLAWKRDEGGMQYTTATSNITEFLSLKGTRDKRQILQKVKHDPIEPTAEANRCSGKLPEEKENTVHMQDDRAGDRD